MSESPRSNLEPLPSELSPPVTPSAPPPLASNAGEDPSAATEGSFVAFEGQFLQGMVSPYLSPDELAAYSRISPAVMKRILNHNMQCIDRANEEARVQAEHRRACEKNALTASVKDREEARALQRRGQWFAISAVAIVFTVILVGFASGYGWPAASIGIPILAGIILASFLGHGLTDGGKSAPPALKPSQTSPDGNPALPPQ